MTQLIIAQDMIIIETNPKIIPKKASKKYINLFFKNDLKASKKLFLLLYWLVILVLLLLSFSNSLTLIFCFWISSFTMVVGTFIIVVWIIFISAFSVIIVVWAFSIYWVVSILMF